MGSLAFMKCWEAFLFVALAFDSYGRCSELLGLQVQDLLMPSESGGMHEWAILLAPSERGQITKVGTSDNTIRLRSVDFDLKPWLARCKRKNASDRVFSISGGKLRAQFADAARRAGFGAFNLSPHQLRHGGASRDALLARLSVDRIQQRGRWKVRSSFLRYEKHGRLQKALNDSSLKAKMWWRICTPAYLSMVGAGEVLPCAPPFA